MPTPTVERPSPTRAPAVMIEAQSARIANSSREKTRSAGRSGPARLKDSAPESYNARSHVASAHQAAEDQQDAGEDDQHAAATAPGIGAVGPLRLIPTTTTEQSPRLHAHVRPPSVQG